jgi:outer membrane protein assembly factor BamB
MVGIGENVLITDSEGQTTVLRNSSDYEVVAKNSIGEPVLASPAISNGDLIIRGTKHLFLIRQLDER